MNPILTFVILVWNSLQRVDERDDLFLDRIIQLSNQIQCTNFEMNNKTPINMPLFLFISFFSSFDSIAAVPDDEVDESHTIAVLCGISVF
jgi:hypothetical protein